MNLSQPGTIGLIVVLLGTFVAPPLISFVKQEGWPKEVNAIVALLVSAIGGFTVWWLTGSGGVPTLSMVAGAAGVIYADTQLVYAGLGFKDSFIDKLFSDLSVITKKSPPVTTITNNNSSVAVGQWPLKRRARRQPPLPPEVMPSTS